ncbi:MAG: recombinase family protein [Clostridium sp.]
MKKNVVLLRVSTDMQDFNSQKNEIDKYVKNNNIIVHKIIEEPGVSGFKTKLDDRVGLQKLIKMASNNELDTIIVFNQDRIGRRLELITFMGLMDENDVKVISVTEGLLNNKNDDSSELMQIMKFYMASLESKKTSYRVKAGKKATMESNGYSGGVANFGYRVENKKLVIDEFESDIVKFAFENYIKEGTQKTIDRLNVDMLKRGEK